VAMYMRESRKEVPVTPISFGLGLALALSLLATLYLGILPNRVLQIAQRSAQELLPQPSAQNSNMAQSPSSTVVPSQ
jgi:NADH:ubiquinone oxidoreductase subunit 2 (subunit N)